MSMGSAAIPERGPPRFALIGLLLLALAVALPYFNFCSDDAYIYLRYIRNLATGSGFAWNPNEPSYGTTGPLWVLLTAPFVALTDAPRVTVKAIALVLVLVYTVLLWKLTGAYGRRWPYRVAIAAVVLLDAWWIKWSMSGLEVPLTLCLTCGGFLAFLRANETDRAPYLAVGLVSLAALARPEAALIVAFMIVFELYTSRSLARAVGLGAVSLAAVLPWHLFALVQLGSFLPSTFHAKHAAFPISLSIKTAVQVLGAGYGLPLLAATIALFRWKKINHGRSQHDVRLLYFGPLVLVAALSLFYIGRGLAVSSRYMLLATPFAAVAGMALGFRLIDELRSSGVRRAVTAAFVGLTIVASIALQYEFVWFVTKWPRGMDERMIVLGEWIDEALPKTIRLGTDQVGTVAYYADRYMKDTSGLCTPEYIPLLKDPDAQVERLGQDGVQLVILWAYNEAEASAFYHGAREGPLLFLGQQALQREGSRDRYLTNYAQLYIHRHAADDETVRRIQAAWEQRPEGLGYPVPSFVIQE